MTEISEARSILRDALKRAGLSGRGSVWRFPSKDVQWVVGIDRPPYGKRLGVEIGLDLQTEVVRPRANDCAVIVYLEQIPGIDYVDVMRAMDMDSTLEDEKRVEYLETAIRLLGDYLAERRTFAAVREAYHAGEFRGFIHKDARARFEAG